ncbi:MAG: Riboflavin biosynthesis protein RibF [Actinobacteria bacterium ADurb.BinA094]|nr:MAG: Riboflavin biosynthesis protein RibF [Actinobacteria bacterium ADurb.BinA094]
MEVVGDIATLRARPRALALGTFDGVHAGHRAVIGRAVDLARERGLTSAVVTFDRHPLTVVDPAHAPRLLTSNEEKIKLIAGLGPDELLLLHFDHELAALSPEEFCTRVLAGALQARVVVVGENFNFGAGGSGDAVRLQECGASLGYEVEVRPLVTEHGATISSTRIRRLLHAGALEEVREILGRPPSAAGVVVHGDKRGRTLGVPTANVDVEAGTIFPGRGVYAARVLVDGAWHRAAVNIGHNPTFRNKDEPTTHITVEAFLLGFHGDIYDREIRLDFLHKIRDERRFESVSALVAQMRRDIEAAGSLADPDYEAVGLPPTESVDL